ncbi:MAG TPA: DUF5804 family protein [Methanocorpusculum sp.]|nr:DUF5804 family protein [Methanocorpusculum sp.]HJJ74577.1 DUF5804 family protein [Methanocorpusculum sp.]
MQVVCIAKQGVNLFQTLTDSETSRHILRFYHPEDIRYGVRTNVSTVSSALSLLSELRWYLMRYTAVSLIEDVEHSVYLTRELAGKVYEERSVQLGGTWEHSFRFAVTENGESFKVPIGVDTPSGTILSFTVWGTERECP